MFDRRIQSALEPLWQAMSRPLIQAGITATQVTLVAWLLGLTAAGLIGAQYQIAGLIFLLLSRACDALDGALARQVGTTQLGGYLDVTLDFWFYAAIPLAFAWQNPEANALAAAALLASFVLNATAWLALAALQVPPSSPPKTTIQKSMSFVFGLTEGGETLIAYLSMCLWPTHFAVIAGSFAALCVISAGLRTLHGILVLRTPKESKIET